MQERQESNKEPLPVRLHHSLLGTLTSLHLL
jgi:hypothetical protein